MKRIKNAENAKKIWKAAKEKKNEKNEICDMLFNVYSRIIFCMQEFILIV
jgi:hypothetical protein